MIDVFFRLYNPFPPPRPKTPFTHVVYLYTQKKKFSQYRHCVQ